MLVSLHYILFHCSSKLNENQVITIKPALFRFEKQTKLKHRKIYLGINFPLGLEC